MYQPPNSVVVPRHNLFYEPVLDLEGLRPKRHVPSGICVDHVPNQNEIKMRRIGNLAYHREIMESTLTILCDIAADQLAVSLLGMPLSCTIWNVVFLSLHPLRHGHKREQFERQARVSDWDYCYSLHPLPSAVISFSLRPRIERLKSRTLCLKSVCREPSVFGSTTLVDIQFIELE